jgi:hypothetical protein
MRCHAVGIAIRLWTERRRNRVSVPGRRQRYFPFSKASIPSLIATQSSTTAYKRHFTHCRMGSGVGMKLITFQQPVPSRIIRGAVPPLYFTSSRGGALVSKCSNVSFELEKGAGARLTAHAVTLCCDIQGRSARVIRAHSYSTFPSENNCWTHLYGSTVYWKTRHRLVFNRTATKLTSN